VQPVAHTFAAVLQRSPPSPQSADIRQSTQLPLGEHTWAVHCALVVQSTQVCELLQCGAAAPAQFISVRHSTQTPPVVSQ
jgi:hypothetical protein